jgi:phage gpG-like protein
MSLQVTLDLRGFAGPEAALTRLDPLDNAKLMDGLARLIQEQTRRRIEEEKKAPDGSNWKPNRAGTSILFQTGALSRSIDYVVQGLRAIVGSGLVYARIQQEGGDIVPVNARALAFPSGNGMVYAQKVTLPPRPYIGISTDNASEITDAAVTYIRKRLGL